MKKILLLITVAMCCIPSPAQWSQDPAVNNRITTIENPVYGRQTQTTDDGRTYIVSICKEDGNQLSYRLQIVGNDASLTFPGQGLVVSTELNWTYTVVNSSLLVDRDGNAIVICHDCRNSSPETLHKSYTVYKIAPDGTMLWGDNGVNLKDGTTFEGSGAMSVCQTTDGGYVFAYETFTDNNGTTKTDVYLEKLTADGKKTWEQALIQDNKNFAYPYVIDAGDNQVMLVYLAGTNQDIMARLLDFDGTPVWNEDTTVYRGGFDSIPAWTFISVDKAPDGGVFISWRDDRYYENSFSGYISYVKNDGSLGFPGGANALKISYADGYSRMNPAIVYDDNQKCLYAVYRQFIQSNQSYNGLFMQKISLDGELLWGSDGKAVMDIGTECSAGYATVQLAGDSDIAVFWQTHNAAEGITMSLAMKYDTDGNPLWESPVSFTTTASEKSGLTSSQLIDGKYWITSWEDFRDSDNLYDSCLYMQRINTDGSLGGDNTGITEIATDTKGNSAATVYDLTGNRVATLPDAGCTGPSRLAPGLYIIKEETSGTTYKTIIK